MSKKKRTSRIVIGGSEALHAFTNRDGVVLHISREEVESGAFGSALERLMALSDSREEILRNRESLDFCVSGYESDSRELAEIPEVRAYFAMLVQQWPHWLWFLPRKIGAISLLLSLLCDVRIHRAAGSFGVEFTNLPQLSAVMADLLERGIALFQAFDISEEDAEASANSAVQELEGF